MTLADLMYKARTIGFSITDTHIPIMKDGLYVKFDLEIEGNSNDGYHIEITNYQEGEQ